MESVKPVFAPQLIIPHGITDVSFYERALGAKELRRFSNDDGTIHVAEFSINGTLFHLHEDMQRINAYNPQKNGSVTTIIDLFVADVDAAMASAIAAGAEVLSPAESYDYGYRQGEVRDPFGHIWMFTQVI